MVVQMVRSRSEDDGERRWFECDENKEGQEPEHNSNNSVNRVSRVIHVISVKHPVTLSA
jgi:hypothetical protein